MTQIFDETISGMQSKYNADMHEATRHIQKLQNLNEKLENECNVGYLFKDLYYIVKGSI